MEVENKDEEKIKNDGENIIIMMKQIIMKKKNLLNYQY